MSERLMPLPPDHVVMITLLVESVAMGHKSGEEGLAWAVENGYIEIVNEEEFRVLDAGREHVADKIIYPELN